MAYIFLVMLVIGTFFGATTGVLPIGELWDKATSTISEQVIPKPEKEIIVENLQKEYESLGTFFTESVPALLKENITPGQRTALEEATTQFKHTKDLLNDLTEEIQNETSIQKTIVEKVISAGSSSTQTTPVFENTTSEPLPTLVPPSCSVQCTQ